MKIPNWAILAVVLLVAGIYTGYLKVPASTGAGPSSTTNIISATDTYDLKVAAMNVPNTAAEFIGGSAYAVSGSGTILAGATTLTGGSSQTYTTMTVPKQASGKIYVVGDGTYSGGEVAFVADSPNKPVVFTKTGDIRSFTANATRVAFKAYDSNLGNDNSTTQAYLYAYTTATHTIGTGGFVTGYFDFYANMSNTRWSSNNGAYLIVSGATQAARNDVLESDVSITPQFIPSDLQFTKVSCSSDPILSRAASYYGYIACYKFSRGVTNKDGELRFRYSITASSGNPGASDDVKIYATDVEPIYEDNSVAYEAFDKSNTDKGVTDSSLTIDLA